MPNSMEQVSVPPELRGVPDEEPETGVSRKALAAIIAIVCLVVGTSMIGVGVGVWVHPGAGVAAAGATLVVVSILLGFAI